MRFPRSRQLANLLVLDEIGSTNAELVWRASGAPAFTATVTLNQTGGRGRLGRQWSTPAGEGLALSVMLRPTAPQHAWSWFPLLAGLAMSRAVQSLLPTAHVGVKWPNDVYVGSRKISGILAELLPDGSGIVIGSGLNLAIPEERLPTPTSTSLQVEGLVGDGVPDAACAAYLSHLREITDAFDAAGGDAHASGLHAAITDACCTIGRDVRIELPGAPSLHGVAVGLDDDGRILIDIDGAVQPVAAGDVTHLRYE